MTAPAAWRCWPRCAALRRDYLSLSCRFARRRPADGDYPLLCLAAASASRLIAFTFAFFIVAVMPLSAMASTRIDGPVILGQWMNRPAELKHFDTNFRNAGFFVRRVLENIAVGSSSDDIKMPFLGDKVVHFGVSFQTRLNGIIDRLWPNGISGDFIGFKPRFVKQIYSIFRAIEGICHFPSRGRSRIADLSAEDPTSFSATIGIPIDAGRLNINEGALSRDVRLESVFKRRVGLIGDMCQIPSGDYKQDRGNDKQDRGNGSDQPFIFIKARYSPTDPFPHTKTVFWLGCIVFGFGRLRASPMRF